LESKEKDDVQIPKTTTPLPLQKKGEKFKNFHERQANYESRKKIKLNKVAEIQKAK
jgi:hypothetical protein